MGVDIIIGDRALAEKLGIGIRTVMRMNKKGILNDARYKRGMRGNAYDLNKVLQILKY